MGGEHQIDDPFADPPAPPPAPTAPVPPRQQTLPAAVEAVQHVVDQPDVPFAKPSPGKGQAAELNLEAIMQHVECGGTISEVAKQLDEKHWRRVQGRIMRLIAASAETQRRYEVATINRAMLWVDGVVQLCEEDCTVDVFNGAGKLIGRKTDSGKVHQLRLRVETQKWAAEHLLPKYSAKEEQRELGDALSTLVRSLAGSGRTGQSALPVAKRVDNDVEDVEEVEVDSK